jgi:hypothetical protein
MVFEFPDDLVNLVRLVWGILNQVFKNCSRAVRIASPPETGRGADPAAARQAGVPSLFVVTYEDQLQMRCGKKVLAGFHLPVAHFCEHAALNFT